MLRAYAKYLRQVRFSLSQSYMEDTLSAHPALVLDLVRLFHARFDPGRAGGAGGGAAGAAGAAPAGVPCPGEGVPPEGEPAYAIAERILAALEAVSSLDEDRILRTFFELIDGTLRTNYHQRAPDGGHRRCLALKLDPSCVHEMPEPKPRFEIFVHSPRLEGVHLRGGPIARGGIRWSDRREDFRTEVLGLLKTQMVKNAVIVPVGSKGGFVLKRPPADRAALAGEGLACYREFISALLELTDNYVEDGVEDGAGEGPGPGGRGRDRAPARHRPPRRRRPLPRGRGRQGHRDLLGPRERALRRGRVLARRRLRLGGLGRLRPQGDRDHRAGGVGVREEPLPGARPRPRRGSRSRPPASAT